MEQADLWIIPLTMAGWEASPLDGRSSTTSCGLTLCADRGTPASAPPPCKGNQGICNTPRLRQREQQHCCLKMRLLDPSGHTLAVPTMDVTPAW